MDTVEEQIRFRTDEMMRDWAAKKGAAANRAPLGSRTVRENFNATVAVGARPRRRSLLGR